MPDLAVPDFIQETGLLERLISASQLRGKVLANNIANQNTPGFTRQEVRFEEILRESLQRGRDASAVRPEVVVDTTTPARPDGNNVQLESEINAARENRLMAETYLTILQGHFEMLRTAMSDR